MVVEGSGARGWWTPSMAYVVAIAAVLPLVAPEAWSGFRLATADDILSVLSVFEQPLSVRSPSGIWALGLALAWFSLAYWHRNVALWEAALVLIGGAAALARAGNLWVDAAALLLPIARQVSLLKLAPVVLACLAAVCLVVAGYSLLQTRPPELPSAAIEAVRHTNGKVLADWRWAPELKRRLGSERDVLASDGLESETRQFWADYVRLAQGHEHWSDILGRLDVGTVVLESGGEQQRAAELVRAAPDWRVTYDVGNTLVAERRSP